MVDLLVTKIMEMRIEVTDEEIAEFELEDEQAIHDYAIRIAFDTPSYLWDNDGDYTVDDY